MSEYHQSAHAVWDIKYHLVWITKYQYKVLRGEVAERARDLLREICAAREVRHRSRGGVAGPRPYVGGGAAAVGAGEAGAVPEGAVVPDVAAGLSTPAQAVLGTTFVGSRVLLRDKLEKCRHSKGRQKDFVKRRL